MHGLDFLLIIYGSSPSNAHGEISLIVRNDNPTYRMLGLGTLKSIMSGDERFKPENDGAYLFTLTNASINSETVLIGNAKSLLDSTIDEQVEVTFNSTPTIQTRITYTHS